MATADDRVDRTAQALSAIYQSVSDPSGWQGAVEALGQALDSRRASLFRVSANGDVLDMFQCGHDPDAQRAYVDHYHTLDPAMPVVLRGQPSQWLDDPDMLRPGPGPSREYVEDYCRPFDLRYLAGTRLIDRDSSQVILSFQRGHLEDPFGRTEQRTFEHLVPHVLRGLNLQAELRQLSRTAAFAQAALDQFRCAAFVVDARARILIRNRAAERLLTIPMGFTASAEVLHLPVTARLANRFAVAVARACEAMPLAAAFPVPRVDGPPWQARVLPVDGAARGLPCERAALVLVARPVDTGPDPATLSEMLGLTPSESDLLVDFARGVELEAIAARRRVSIATIRTQVRSIYQKTGASNQRELTALTRTLPSA